MRIITFSILDILLFSIIFYIFNFELNYILVVILEPGAFLVILWEGIVLENLKI